MTTTVVSVSQAREIAAAAAAQYRRDEGVAWDVTSMPITEVHDYCRDAAYDFLVATDGDVDSDLEEVTEAALYQTGI